ncbi:MAG: DNA repair protein RadA, partial [Lachnospiraceae bacterium]|nr:DNA repair protein RadA [Lachnospiraceae bacterium]
TTVTDFYRVNLLMSVLEKRLGLQIGDFDAYVNIAGGMKISEPAIDLGLILAIVSSFKNRPVDEKTIVFGEVGLSGEVRAVTMAQQRVQEARKLGYETVIMPRVNLEAMDPMDGIKVIGGGGIVEAIEAI